MCICRCTFFIVLLKLFLLLTEIFVYRSYRDKTGKDHSLMEAIRPLWALLSIIVLCTVWIALSPNDVLNYDPRIVYTRVATLFSNVTGSE